MFASVLLCFPMVSLSTLCIGCYVCFDFVTILQQLTVPLRVEFLDLLQAVYKHKLKVCCGKEELTIANKTGNELLVTNCFLRRLVQLLEVEGYALPKLLDDE